MSVAEYVAVSLLEAVEREWDIIEQGIIERRRVDLKDVLTSEDYAMSLRLGCCALL